VKRPCPKFEKSSSVLRGIFVSVFPAGEAGKSHFSKSVGPCYPVDVQPLVVTLNKTGRPFFANPALEKIAWGFFLVNHQRYHQDRQLYFRHRSYPGHVIKNI